MIFIITLLGLSLVGRATYDASQEIRSGDLIREEGVALVNKYDGEFPERRAEEIFEYLSLPADKFPAASKHFEQPIFDRIYYDLLADNFRSPHLWKYSDSKGWELRHIVNNEDSTGNSQNPDSWQGNLG